MSIKTRKSLAVLIAASVILVALLAVSPSIMPIWNKKDTGSPKVTEGAPDYPSLPEPAAKQSPNRMAISETGKALIDQFPESRNRWFLDECLQDPPFAGSDVLEVTGRIQINISQAGNLETRAMEPAIKQQQQIQQLIAECEEWRTLLDSAPENRKKLLADSVEQVKQFESLYEGYYALEEGPALSEAVTSAREDMKSGLEEVSWIATIFLLEKDYFFRQALLETIGSRDHAKLIRESVTISNLRNCMIFGGCGADSRLMIRACINDEKACGQDYISWTQGLFSTNEFDDLMQLASAVDRVLEQGLHPLDP